MGGGSGAALSGDQQRVIRLETASRTIALSLVALGCAVLFGWLLRWQVLISLSPRFAAMKPNTALGFLCTGAALWSLRGDVQAGHRTGRRLACGVLLLGSLTLLEYVSGWDLGIDRVFYGGADPGRWPARMSISAAVHFTLLGGALLVIDTHWGRAQHRPSEWLALLVSLSAFAALLGYMYGVDSLYAIRPYSSMALHTAIAFQLCAFGILFARPAQGLMRVVSSSGPGGQLVRKVLPPIVLIPISLGWLRVKGQNAELFGTAFGTAVFVASCIVCLSTLVVSTAMALHASDLERRQAEHKLQENEDNLAITLKSIGDGVITTDIRGLITNMNPVATELTRWPLQEALGKPLASVFQVLDEDTREPIATPVERILSDGSMVGRPLHTVLVARDGSSRAIADSGAPIRDAQGTSRGVVLVFRDQTDERETERALLESETRFSHLAYSGILGIIIADLNGRIHELNDAFLRMLGYTRADFDLGQIKLWDLTPPEWKAQDAIALEQFKGTGAIRAREKEYFRKDGSRAPVLVVARCSTHLASSPSRSI